MKSLGSYSETKVLCVCVCVCVRVFSEMPTDQQRTNTSPTLGVMDVAADPGSVDIQECKTLNNQSANTQRILGCWIITNSLVMGR